MPSLPLFLISQSAFPSGLTCGFVTPEGPCIVSWLAILKNDAFNSVMRELDANERGSPFEL